MSLHPASLLTTWLAAALLLQWLTGPQLLIPAAIVLPAALRWSKPRLLTLLRRARWLLLSIVLLFSLATPGLVLLHLMGEPGSGLYLTITDEGLRQAYTHALRLTLLLALLALLLEKLSLTELIGGLHALLAPLGSHPYRNRLALRLLLTLEYIEQGRQFHAQKNQPGWKYWLMPVANLQTPTPTANETAIQIPDLPLRPHDVCIMAFTLATVILTWLLHG